MNDRYIINKEDELIGAYMDWFGPDAASCSPDYFASFFSMLKFRNPELQQKLTMSVVWDDVRNIYFSSNIEERWSKGPYSISCYYDLEEALCDWFGDSACCSTEELEMFISRLDYKAGYMEKKWDAESIRTLLEEKYFPLHRFEWWETATDNAHPVQTDEGGRGIAEKSDISDGSGNEGPFVIEQQGDVETALGSWFKDSASCLLSDLNEFCKRLVFKNQEVMQEWVRYGVQYVLMEHYFPPNMEQRDDKGNYSIKIDADMFAAITDWFQESTCCSEAELGDFMNHLDFADFELARKWSSQALRKYLQEEYFPSRRRS